MLHALRNELAPGQSASRDDALGSITPLFSPELDHKRSLHEPPSLHRPHSRRGMQHGGAPLASSAGIGTASVHMSHFHTAIPHDAGSHEPQSYSLQRRAADSPASLATRPEHACAGDASTGSCVDMSGAAGDIHAADSGCSGWGGEGAALVTVAAGSCPPLLPGRERQLSPALAATHAAPFDEDMSTSRRVRSWGRIPPSAAAAATTSAGAGDGGGDSSSPPPPFPVLPSGHVALQDETDWPGDGGIDDDSSSPCDAPGPINQQSANDDAAEPAPQHRYHHDGAADSKLLVVQSVRAADAPPHRHHGGVGDERRHHHSRHDRSPLRRREVAADVPASTALATDTTAGAAGRGSGSSAQPAPASSSAAASGGPGIVGRGMYAASALYRVGAL